MCIRDRYDIAVIMVKAGLGIAALVILVFSTVTTTFLDAWSAGISAESLSAKLNGKKTAIAVTVIGTAAAILFPMDDIDVYKRQGYDLDTSVERAKAYISGALAAMLALGHGSGPMNHMFALKGDFVE